MVKETTVGRMETVSFESAVEERSESGVDDEDEDDELL